MIRNILRFIMTMCLILPCMFMISACDDGITDCAYVRFITATNEQVVVYNSSDMNGYYGEHIYLYENEAKKNEGHFSSNLNYLLKIQFNRVLDQLPDETETTLIVDIEGWYYMEIQIRKDYYYNSIDNTPKKLYLNGVDITSKATPTLSEPPKLGSNALGSFWYDGHYYFEDLGFVKGNKNNFINKIEFK